MVPGVRAAGSGGGGLQVDVAPVGAAVVTQVEQQMTGLVSARCAPPPDPDHDDQHHS